VTEGEDGRPGRGRTLQRLRGRRALPTALHADALRLATILVSGGRRGHEVELASAEVVRLTGATVAAIAR